MSNENGYSPLSDEAFCERLTQVRLDADLDQRGMAGQLRVAVPTYYKYETGERRPNRRTMFRIALIFKVSFDWLLLGRGRMYYEEQVPKEEMEAKLKEVEARYEQQLEKVKHEIEQERVRELEEQVKGLTQKLAQLEPDVLPGVKPEVKELVHIMNHVPLLYYEIMLQFQRFKVDNKDVINEGMSAVNKG